MKNIKYILGLFLIAGLGACNTFLDEPQPAQSLPSATAFTRAQDIENAMVGAYDAAQGARMFGTNVCMLPGIYADNGEWRGSFPSYRDIFNLMIVSDNAEVAGMWQLGYRVINAANLILQALETVQDPALTTELRNRLRGEALFLRGATHFEMVRYFGIPFNQNSGAEPGIPVMTAPVATTDDVTFPSRSSVAEVYNRVIADLQEATTLLPATNPQGRGRATRYSALGYLARAAFQQRDYNKAAADALQVLNGPFSLNPEPRDFYVSVDRTPEEIWVIVHTVQDNPGVNGSLATFHNRQGRGGDVVVAQDLVDDGYNRIVTPAQRDAITGAGYSVVDLRLTQLTQFDAPSSTYFIEKYIDFTNNADNAPIQRLAEYLLMRAEALARTDGINQESLDLLNQVRRRALRVLDADGDVVPNGASFTDFQAGDFASADELIEAIITERRVELAFEGSRYHDLMRLQRPVKGAQWNDPRLRFPIPQRELDANGNLTQNPGY
jgi:hypothetical protein